MCGIAGVRVFEGSEVVAAGLRRMGCIMAARGPDDEGLFIGPGVGLIHRRLSILDLSELGNCPMPNEDGSVQVLLNGEIYNWRELRAELLAHGHRFRSMSDSEVLSHGYEEWGEGLFTACVACSLWLSGISRAHGCCWRATGWAKNRSFTFATGANPFRIEYPCPARL